MVGVYVEATYSSHGSQEEDRREKGAEGREREQGETGRDRERHRPRLR